MPTLTTVTAELPKAWRDLADKGFVALVVGMLLLTVIRNRMSSQLGPTIAQVFYPTGGLPPCAGM